MEERIISQANIWGFLCKCNEGIHQILPKNATERWKLQLSEEKKWLLIVDGVPQILCCQGEVIRFLERRRLNIESSFDIRSLHS